MRYRQGLTLVAVVLLVLLSGCEGNNNSPMRAVQGSEFDENKTAWLHRHLPKQTVAYLNVPTPWSYLFAAKADALQGVQSLSVHQDQVNAIKQGIYEQYLPHIPTKSRELMSLILQHMESTLEIAVINYSESGIMPNVAVATRLSGISADDLMKQLEPVLQSFDPAIALVRQQRQEAEDSPPIWQFELNKLQSYIQFDESSGQLLMLGGLGANTERLTSLWNDSTASELSAVTDLSQQIDPSGLNLKAWVAPQQILKLGGPLIPPQQAEQLTQLALDQVEYIWMGTGSAKGQASLNLHVVMPEVAWRQYLPRVNDWFDVNMAGMPESVWQFSLPTAAQLSLALENYSKNHPKLTEAQQQDMDMLVDFEKYSGFTAADFLNAHGQQFYRVTDESGTWMAMKINDRGLYNKISQSFYELYETEPVKREFYGTEIHELHFSMYQTLFKLTENQADSSLDDAEWLSIFRDHVYWYEEDNILYMSYVPQVLAQKRNHKKQIPLSAWLDRNQGSNWKSAVFAYGRDVKGMPQALYHHYLRLLQYIGDLARVEVDLFDLPTATDMNMPDQGRINLALSSDEQKVSLVLGYEFTVMDPLVTGEGGMMAIATVAILAAYAIPAYRDYTMRAKVGGILARSAVYKITLSEQYVSTGSFAGINATVETEGTGFTIDEASGTIVIDLRQADETFKGGGFIYLEPELVSDHSIVWHCSGTIKKAQLPASCEAL